MINAIKFPDVDRNITDVDKWIPYSINQIRNKYQKNLVDYVEVFHCLIVESTRCVKRCAPPFPKKKKKKIDKFENNTS